MKTMAVDRSERCLGGKRESVRCQTGFVQSISGLQTQEGVPVTPRFDQEGEGGG